MMRATNFRSASVANSRQPRQARNYATNYNKPTTIKIKPAPSVEDSDSPLLKWLSNRAGAQVANDALEFAGANPDAMFSLRKLNKVFVEKFDSDRPVLGDINKAGLVRMKAALGEDFVKDLGEFATPFAVNDMSVIKARQAIISETLARYGIYPDAKVTAVGPFTPPYKFLKDTENVANENGTSLISGTTTLVKDAEGVSDSHLYPIVGLAEDEKAAILKDRAEKLGVEYKTTSPQVASQAASLATRPSAIPAEVVESVDQALAEALEGLKELRSALADVPEFERDVKFKELLDSNPKLRLAAALASFASVNRQNAEVEESLQYLAKNGASEIGIAARELLAARAEAASLLQGLSALPAPERIEKAAKLQETNPIVKKVADLEAALFGKPLFSGEAQLALEQELLQVSLRIAEHTQNVAPKDVSAFLRSTAYGTSLVEYGNALDLALRSQTAEGLLSAPGANLTDLLTAASFFPETKPDHVKLELSKIFNDRTGYTYTNLEDLRSLNEVDFSSALGAGDIHPDVVKQLLDPVAATLKKNIDTEDVDEAVAHVLTAMWNNVNRLLDGPGAYKVLLPLVPQLRRFFSGDTSSVDYHLNKSPLQFLNEMKYNEIADRHGWSSVQRLEIAKSVEFSAGSFTLEWLLPSPPPEHTWEEIPIIKELPDAEPEPSDE